MSNSELNCLFLGNPEDKPYLAYLKGMFNGHNTWVCLDKIELLSHLEMYCAKKSITKVISTSRPILSKLLELRGTFKSEPSLASYSGSYFNYKNLEIVFIDPLSQLFSVSYGKFLAARYISKLVSKSSWHEATSFQWEILEASTIDSCYAQFKQAILIAVDIETFKVNLVIRCIGYTAIFIDSVGRITSRSVVLPMDSEWALVWMRKFNSLEPAKVTQNGKYDNSYLLRYNAPLHNWLWDTANMMHCWYSELPKDLAFLNAFFLRSVVYWKDLANTQDLHEYYKYNAMDTWATANVAIQWILSAPDWAKHNYVLEFPLNFPCLLAEMTGIKRDTERVQSARKEIDAKESVTLAQVRTMLGAPSFNPGSPVQVKSLLKLLGCGDIESSNEKDLAKAKLRHPLNALIIDKILDIRGWRKSASTYLRLDSDADKGKDNGAKEFFGRILYSLNPHNTDTGRLASREHHFWTGLQIQNVTRGEEIKQTFCSDDGFFLAECDLEQAESRDTANISGDENLIRAVSGSRDFHSVNCSAFFGVSYESIFDDSTGKTKNKELRDLSKRVNHGANYNMGPRVLVDTMGLDKIWQAKKLLKLSFLDPIKIAEYLLDCFHKTYPSIKGKYYVSVINEIGTTRKLVSRAYHHTEFNKQNLCERDAIERGDWTRYCFGNPDKNKSDLNAYAAHCPQSLNARTLNEAWMKVFYEIALPNPISFRLHAQIHDSILFSYQEGRQDLAYKVRECMEIPVTIRDVSGTCRIFTVPAALKIGKNGKPAKYWSETE